jgi:hypothetical protein
VKQKVLRAFVGMFLLTAALMLAFVSPASLSRTVQAKPAFMDRYNRDPYAKPQLKDKCTLCHIGKGGEQRNDFGDAFEDAGFRITPKLRAKFPNLFEYPKSTPDERK